MTRTDYALAMSNTPSDPDHINTKALEGMMGAFDHALRGKYGLGSAYPPAAKPQKLDLEAIRKITALVRACAPIREEKIEQREQQTHPASFWYTFPPLRAILCFRDRLRLRKYNRKWIKNNIASNH